MMMMDTDKDRPIQAGDWVECVDAKCRGGQLTVGARYQVERMFEQSYPRRPPFALHGVESPKFGWCASRFKRVDGPHPANSSGAVGTGNAQSSVPDETRPLCSTPACAARGVVATHGKQCVYCANATECGTRERGELTEMMFLVMRGEDAKGEARDRMAAMARAEQSRGNRADEAMFRKGPPPSWPSVGDDEP